VLASVQRRYTCGEPVHVGARMIRIADPLLRAPLTHPAPIAWLWQGEYVPGAFTQSHVKLTSVAVTDDLHLIVLDRAGRPVPVAALDVRGAMARRHPHWPEVLVLSRAGSWAQGDVVEVRAPCGITLATNPVVFEAADPAVSEMHKQGDANVVSGPSHESLTVTCMAVRAFAALPRRSLHAGGLAAAICRRLLPVRHVDPRLVALVAVHRGTVAARKALALHSYTPDGPQWHEALQRTTCEVLRSTHPRCEVFYVRDLRQI
jgi:hypothetical protein